MSYYQDTLNATALLVQLTRGTEPVEGRVRIQKMVYLLKALGLPRLRTLKFSYHHYGPYSDQLAGALRSAVASELIREDAQQFDDEWQKFNYQLNDAHPDAKFFELDERELELVESLKSAVDRLHWRVLELAATARFLELERKLPRNDAIDLALRHKPACKPYRAEAERLLQTLAERLQPAATQAVG